MPPPPLRNDSPAPPDFPERRTGGVDLRTPTGVWNLVSKRYGRRRGDRPYPWRFLITYRLIELVFYVASVVLGLLVKKWIWGP